MLEANPSQVPFVARTDALPRPVDCTWTNGGSEASWMHLAGEFDIATTPQLDRALRQPLIKSRLSVIDMRDVDFLDCSAVRALTAAGERARKDGHRLVLLAPRPSVERMFALTMTDQQNEIVHGEGFYALRG